MVSKAHTGALRASRSWVCGGDLGLGVTTQEELKPVSGSPEAEPLLTALSWGWCLGGRPTYLLEGGAWVRCVWPQQA